MSTPQDNMKIEENLKIIRDVVFQSNPDVYSPTELEPLLSGRPIRLADVLTLFHKESFYRVGEIASHWNLREDDLSKQSPETLEFLANLLKHE